MSRTSTTAPAMSLECVGTQGEEDIGAAFAVDPEMDADDEGLVAAEQGRNIREGEGLDPRDLEAHLQGRHLPQSPLGLAGACDADPAQLVEPALWEVFH